MRDIILNGSRTKTLAFTLIEVLVALAIIAIAVTALLKAISQTITTTQRLNNRTIQHLVSKQAANMIQLGLTSIEEKHKITEVTVMLGQRWYWHAHMSPTNIHNIYRIDIDVSEKSTGPFTPTLTAFHYLPKMTH